MLSHGIAWCEELTSGEDVYNCFLQAPLHEIKALPPACIPDPDKHYIEMGLTFEEKQKVREFYQRIKKSDEFV